MPRTAKQFDTMRAAMKDRITAAGLKLFSHKGLAATSIQDIASEAGISTGLMYHYYPSKEDLFNELVESAVTSAAQAIQALFGQAQLSPAEKIRRFSAQVLEEISRGSVTNQYYLLMILASLAEEIPERAKRLRQESFAPLELISNVIAQGQQQGDFKPGDPYQMALAFFALIQGLAVYRLTIGEWFVPPSVELVTGLLLK